MNRPRVLVVDDERQILRALELKLRNDGYTVDTATTAKEALAQAAMRPPMRALPRELRSAWHRASLPTTMRA